MATLTANDFVFLAEKNSTLIGFVAVWETDKTNFRAILDNLHMLPGEKATVRVRYCFTQQQPNFGARAKRFPNYIRINSRGNCVKIKATRK